MFSLRGAVTRWLIPLLLGQGCSSETKHPPLYQRPLGDAGTDAGMAIPVDAYDASVPPEDTSNLCGNLILRPVAARPNLYLVLDRSGSMRDSFPDPATGRSTTKYSGAMNAIHDVLFSLGHRLAYGAALFPRRGDVTSCTPGGEVFPVVPGDSVTYARSQLDGPNLARLMKELSRYLPEGATPTSATLSKLVEPLTNLGGKTVVILATDGAPNCNENATCDGAHCTLNIEQETYPGCDSSINCCDSDHFGPLNCVDEKASVDALAALQEHGIATYVVGLPGTEAYRETLNHFAVAGGTARVQPTATDPLYFPVNDSAELTATLKGITAAIAIECQIRLDETPEDWSQVNVYFDNSLVKMSSENGWRQTGEQSLEATGEHCDLLKSGDVFQVQVAVGCPTEILL